MLCKVYTNAIFLQGTTAYIVKHALLILKSGSVTVLVEMVNGRGGGSGGGGGGGE